MASLGERLRSLRDDFNETQQRMADLVDVGLRTYQRWENDEREPAREQIKIFRDFFGVSLDYLYGYEDDPRRISDIMPNPNEQAAGQG